MIWGGPISHHFGHQIADYSNRLLRAVIELPDLPVAFATKPEYGMTTIDEAPRYFRQILDWFGLDRSRRRLITGPSIADELVVFPQAEQLPQPGPSIATLDRLDALSHRRLGDCSRASGGTIYVSRAGHISRFAGEAYLEKALEAAGVTVIRPETLELAAQLRRYHDAERLLFAEGSAMHTL